MRRHYAFRPGMFDQLEDRVALSPAGATATAWVHQHARGMSAVAHALAADRAASMSLVTALGGQGDRAYIGIAGFTASEVGPAAQMAQVARRHNIGHFAGFGPGFGHGGGPNFGGHGGGLFGNAGVGSGGARR